MYYVTACFSRILRGKKSKSRLDYFVGLVFALILCFYKEAFRIRMNTKTTTIHVSCTAEKTALSRWNESGLPSVKLNRNRP